MTDRDEQDTAAIRAEIQAIRDRMGNTVEELGERLNPNELKAQVKQDIHDATIGKVQHMAQNVEDRIIDARRTVMDSVRENPVPAAMVGLGLGWLIYSARQMGSVSGATVAKGMSQKRSERLLRGADAEHASDFNEGFYEDPTRVGRAREKAGELAGRAKDAVTDVASRARDVVSETADRAEDVAGTVADQTRYQARRVRNQMYENPLVVGVAAIAMGTVAGLVLPETRKEQELLGDARDRLADKTREVVQETGAKVQHVAERVATQAQTTAKEAANEEGLTL